jgi:hypothetical protein
MHACVHGADVRRCGGGDCADVEAVNPAVISVVVAV